jgi:hypothetical protein
MLYDKIKLINASCRQDGTYIKEADKDKPNAPKTVSVWSKIKYFREILGDDYSIITSMMEYDEHYICKCEIRTVDLDKPVATGHYKQFKKKNGSYLPGAFMMAETFAISRALTFFGILDSDITSLEEYESLPINMFEGSKGTTKPNGKDSMNNTGMSVEEIKDSLNSANNVFQLRRKFKGIEPLLHTYRNPSIYREVKNIYDNKMAQLNKEGV